MKSQKGKIETRAARKSKNLLQNYFFFFFFAAIFISPLDKSN
jgi:hypothetical protein